MKKELTGTSTKFWTVNTNGQLKIKQVDLIKFLESRGYVKIENDKELFIAHKSDNILRALNGTHELVEVVQSFLVDQDEPSVLEAFARGVSSYLAPMKLNFLPKIKYRGDRDPKDTCWFYFKNTAVKVTENDIVMVPYSRIPHEIWDTSIIDLEFSMGDAEKSNFHDFMNKLSGDDQDRLRSLMSIIGYLLHRNHDPSNRRAIILLDRNISSSGQTNGGSGKTLLLQALGKLRNLEMMDGKNIKTKSWFKNQRIERETDIILYDDVPQDFNFESMYSMITGDIPVEKKRQDEFIIKAEDAPKIAITSNYVVRGPGGSSDKRRRCEYEVENYFHANHQPIDEYGERFFDGWNDNQWNDFFTLMMNCVQLYLKHGLIIPSPINLEKNRLVSCTSEEFVDFGENHLEPNRWMNKRVIHGKYNVLHPDKTISSHAFTKMLKAYADQKNLIYEDKSSGGEFSFILESQKERSNEEE